MGKRKALSAKTRFEVFKRDKFTCQYCGAKAPDVILHCDHIQAVKNGGSNDILNLLTACQDCNGGKGARPLDQAVMMEKQVSQLAELEQRRQQVEMLMKWRESLKEHDDAVLEHIRQHIANLTGYRPGSSYDQTIRKWLKTDTLDAILNMVDDVFEYRFKKTPWSENATIRSLDFAMNGVGPALGASKMYGENAKKFALCASHDKVVNDCFQKII